MLCSFSSSGVLSISEAEKDLKRFKPELNINAAKSFWAKGKKYLYNIKCSDTLPEPVVEAVLM
jgi:hypothetical protein